MGICYPLLMDFHKVHFTGFNFCMRKGIILSYSNCQEVNLWAPLRLFSSGEILVLLESALDFAIRIDRAGTLAFWVR